MKTTTALVLALLIAACGNGVDHYSSVESEFDALNGTEQRAVCLLLGDNTGAELITLFDSPSDEVIRFGDYLIDDTIENTAALSDALEELKTQRCP